MQRLLSQYERRGVITRAVIWGTAIASLSFLLDALAHHLSLTWLNERVVVNFIEGLAFAVLIAFFIRARERRLKLRFHEIGYLNHHIRNSLTIIWYSEQVNERTQRYQMIHEACNRIEKSLEKVSRHEDCIIDKNDPQKI